MKMKKKAFFLVALFAGLALSSVAHATPEQVLNTLLQCGLQGPSELYEFRLEDDGVLRARVGTQNLQNVALEGNELIFDLVTKDGVVTHSLSRRGMKWQEADGTISTFGRLCMRPLREEDEEKVAAVQ